MQLLRVQSPEGTKRIEILPSATVRDLYEQIQNAFQLDGYGFAVYRERNHTKELATSRSQTVEDQNLKHGDMIYLKNLFASSSSSPSVIKRANAIRLFSIFFSFQFISFTHFYFYRVQWLHFNHYQAPVKG